VADDPLRTNAVGFRFARAEDSDEGHRNAMTPAQLAERMSNWLTSGEYRAVLFESGGDVCGYALYRREPDHVYLRQLFVRPEFRRRGIATRALQWLWRHAWPNATQLRIDVLVRNTPARAFWQAVGFRDYCVTMEADRPADAVE
jgi:GNAT superfamily N-acetyltransferase